MLERNFNSQPHEEADFQICWFRQFSNYFNSQPHEEADDTGKPPIIRTFINTTTTKKFTSIHLKVLPQKRAESGSRMLYFVILTRTEPLALHKATIQRKKRMITTFITTEIASLWVMRTG